MARTEDMIIYILSLGGRGKYFQQSGTFFLQPYAGQEIRLAGEQGTYRLIFLLW
jgi:hypothetical protein